MPLNILRIDASARHDGSHSRAAADALLARLPGAQITVRDLARTPVPPIDADWATGTFTPPEARNEAQIAALSLSDGLVRELQAADLVLISTATYNFNIPAALKAWIDQVARAGVTFRYTETGPEGLLTGKRAIVLRASAGTPTGTEADFATPYLTFILGFMGITDVTFLDAPAGAEAREAMVAKALHAVAEPA